MSEVKKEKKYSVVHKVIPMGVELLEPKSEVIMTGLSLVAANAVAEDKFDKYKFGKWSMSCDNGKYDFWRYSDDNWMTIQFKVSVLEEDANGKIKDDESETCSDNCIDDLPF